jgi:general stress protein YciG
MAEDQSKKPRGLAVTKLKNPAKVVKIARKGGLAVQKSPTGKRFFSNRDKASEAGTKSGKATLAKYGKEHFKRLSALAQEVIARKKAERRLLKEMEQSNEQT